MTLYIFIISQNELNKTFYYIEQRKTIFKEVFPQILFVKFYHKVSQIPLQFVDSLIIIAFIKARANAPGATIHLRIISSPQNNPHNFQSQVFTPQTHSILTRWISNHILHSRIQKKKDRKSRYSIQMPQNRLATASSLHQCPDCQKPINLCVPKTTCHPACRRRDPEIPTGHQRHRPEPERHKPFHVCVKIPAQKRQSPDTKSPGNRALLFWRYRLNIPRASRVWIYIYSPFSLENAAGNNGGLV